MNWTADIPVRILGRGKSGLAAACLCESQGGEARIFDETDGDEEFEEEVDRSKDSVLWVLSPGFAESHPWLKRLRSVGATLVPELEFGSYFLRGDLVVLTGSLGKTSMVLFLSHLLESMGQTVSVSGNIGVPVSQMAEEQPHADFHLIEASSFQLESIQDFHPRRAVCLNLYPNHLDRHPSYPAYAEAKANLFRNMTATDIAVWPEEYPVPVRTRARRVRPESVLMPTCSGTAFASGPLRDNLAMALAGLEGVQGLEPPVIEDAARSFSFPDHRMQVLDFPGMGTVIDDSKSTCFAATRGILQRFSGRVHLFMGGMDKDQDPEELASFFREKNPYLYLFGVSGKKMQKAWQDSVDVCVFADSLSEVMEYLYTHRISAQEPVIFSPGCASFDQYSGFAARGRHFQDLFAHQSSLHPFT